MCGDGKQVQMLCWAQPWIWNPVMVHNSSLIRKDLTLNHAWARCWCHANYSHSPLLTCSGTAHDSSTAAPVQGSDPAREQVQQLPGKFCLVKRGSCQNTESSDEPCPLLGGEVPGGKKWASSLMWGWKCLFHQQVAWETFLGSFIPVSW